jgi:hypothetical protein
MSGPYPRLGSYWNLPEVQELLPPSARGLASGSSSCEAEWEVAARVPALALRLLDGGVARPLAFLAVVLAQVPDSGGALPLVPGEAPAGADRVAAARTALQSVSADFRTLRTLYNEAQTADIAMMEG